MTFRTIVQGLILAVLAVIAVERLAMESLLQPKYIFAAFNVLMILLSLNDRAARECGEGKSA